MLNFKKDKTMKKTYINPNIEVVNLNVKTGLLAGSGGVTTDSTPGNAYNSGDVSYGHDDEFDW